MSAGRFYILPERISLSYSILQMRLSDLPRKKPPPAEVADVYESDRCRLILSSFYAWIEGLMQVSMRLMAENRGTTVKTVFV